MLYASTRLTLLKSLGSTVFTDSIFATSKEDLTADAYTSHLRHVAAPHPLSIREQEMIELRAAERETASYDGSRARTSYVGAGVGLNWSEEAERAVKELGQGTGSSTVVFVSWLSSNLPRFLVGFTPPPTRQWILRTRLSSYIAPRTYRLHR